MKRCDQVVVRLVVTEYNDAGFPVGESISDPFKVFRASTPDFWASVDTMIEQPAEKPDLPVVRPR